MIARATIKARVEVALRHRHAQLCEYLLSYTENPAARGPDFGRELLKRLDETEAALADPADLVDRVLEAVKQ